MRWPATISKQGELDFRVFRTKVPPRTEFVDLLDFNLRLELIFYNP